MWCTGFSKVAIIHAPLPSVICHELNPGLRFSKFRFALSKMGMGPAGGRGVTEQSISAAPCTCTRVSSAPILALSLNPGPPFRHWRMAPAGPMPIFPGRGHPRPGLNSLTWDHRPKSPAWDSKQRAVARSLRVCRWGRKCRPPRYCAPFVLRTIRMRSQRLGRVSGVLL